MFGKVRDHCRASDAVWLICRSTSSRWIRWCMIVCLRLCMCTSLVPPPPSPRAPAVRYVLLVFWWTLSVLVTGGNQYQLMAGARSFIAGFSTISRISFMASTVMTAIQPTVVLFNNMFNFRNTAPAASALLMPPLRFHVSFVAMTLSMVGLLVGKHAMYYQSNRKPLLSNALEFFASFITLSFDTVVFFLCLCAEDKIHEVNARLSTVARVVPELRPLILETALRQYELTANHIDELGSVSTIGVPMACNSIRHRVKLVTDSYLVYRSIENISTMHSGTLTALVVQLAAGIGRIIAHSMAGERLQHESTRTEAVIGAVNTTAWPERERMMVERILRLSRRGICWSMGGLARMNHGFLLSVVGSTITYLVVLMQYKDPTSSATISNTTLPSERR